MGRVKPENPVWTLVNHQCWVFSICLIHFYSPPFTTLLSAAEDWSVWTTSTGLPQPPVSCQLLVNGSFVWQETKGRRVRSGYLFSWLLQCKLLQANFSLSGKLFFLSSQPSVSLDTCINTENRHHKQNQDRKFLMPPLLSITPSWPQEITVLFFDTMN